MITERCDRLIVVLSPEFFKSPANTFFINYTQALGIQQSKRKIIPCLFKSCQLPPSLSYLFVLNYMRMNKYWNFWQKLHDSLQKIPETIAVASTNIDLPRCVHCTFLILFDLNYQCKLFICNMKIWKCPFGNIVCVYCILRFQRSSLTLILKILFFFHA